MKHLLIVILVAIAAQTSAQTVTKAGLSTKNDEMTLHFEVSKEVNIKYYLLEGSNDNDTYEVITRIASKGNSMLRRKYNVTIPDASYGYFRLRQVDMNNACFYTTIDNNNTMTLPVPDRETIIPEPVVSSKK